MPRPVSATFDLAALRSNLARARACAPGARVFAVVKADAYGHGLARVARALRDADGFALVELDAAVRLREAGFHQRIALLEGFFDLQDLRVMVEYRLTTVVHAAEQVALLDTLAPGSGLDVLLKVDTGMNRLGFGAQDLRAVVARLARNPGIGRITLMTHFANADDARGVNWQVEALEHMAAGLELPRCLANSAAILRHPGTHADWVRAGIMLYGCSPFGEPVATELGLLPVMTLASRIIAVRELQPGDSVGYNGTFTAHQPMRIGVVACGYADGYPRLAPTGTPVAVDGHLTGTVGRVSMDKLCVDLSELPEAGVGAEVVLWGRGNPVERVAAAAGTVGYELLCALAARVPVVETGA